MAPRRKDPARKIADLLAAIEQRLTGEDIRCTIGDYIRLLQAQQEFERETLRDIEVKWIDAPTIQREPEP